MRAKRGFSEKLSLTGKRRKRIQITYRITETAMLRLEQVAQLFGMKPGQYAKAVLYRDLGLFLEPIDRRKIKRERRHRVLTWEQEEVPE